MSDDLEAEALLREVMHSSDYALRQDLRDRIQSYLANPPERVRGWAVDVDGKVCLFGVEGEAEEEAYCWRMSGSESGAIPVLVIREGADDE